VSIKPPSDIVLDVARAADPARAIAAAEKLARIGERASGAAFSSLLEASPDASRSPPAEFRTQLGHMGGAASTAAPVSSGSKAYKGLEQLVLQHLVENMLPKDPEFFGAGSAGDIWRSMLAEQLAAQIGKSVNLGLCKPHTPGADG